MNRRLLRRLLGALAFAALAALVLVLAAGPDGEAEGGAPHSGSVDRGEMRRLLRATDAATVASSRAELVAKGRRLFRTSVDVKDGESCQSCHTDGGANAQLGTITHPQSEGDFVGPRDPPSLWGVARTAPYRWPGDIPTLQEMVVDTVVNHFKDGQTQEQIGERSAALAAYLQQLDPPVSAFDQGTMSAAALRGEKLFQGKAGCIGCHGGPLFTDNGIHDTGVPQVAGANDPGAPRPAGAPLTPGPFMNTPQLRDLRDSAPYMHNGVFKTLREVVEFYNTDALTAPLRLTQTEIDDLLAFLEAL